MATPDQCRMATPGNYAARGMIGAPSRARARLPVVLRVPRLVGYALRLVNVLDLAPSVDGRIAVDMAIGQAEQVRSSLVSRLRSNSGVKMTSPSATRARREPAISARRIP